MWVLPCVTERFIHHFKRLASHNAGRLHECMALNKLHSAKAPTHLVQEHDCNAPSRRLLPRRLKRLPQPPLTLPHVCSEHISSRHHVQGGAHLLCRCRRGGKE